MEILPFAGFFNWLRHDALRITLPRICAIGLAALAALVYVPFLRNPLVFDDFNIVNSTDLLDYVFRFNVAPRWLPYATLAHTYALTDGSISAMRWGNLVLHAAAAIAVFVLMREICTAALATDIDQQHRDSRAFLTALLAAALFAVHPVAVYGVGYLVQRTILMSTLFMLLMLIAYLRWLMTGRSALWAWSAVWYLLSVYSKEHSVMAPAVALLLALVIHRPTPALARRLAPLFMVYALIAALVIAMAKGIFGAAYEPYALDMLRDIPGMMEDRLHFSYPLSVLTQSYLYFKYLFLWTVPNVNWMSLDIRESVAPALNFWPYGLAAPLFLGYPFIALAMVLRGGRTGIAGWVMAYPWLMFATELFTIRVQEPFVLYRAYLWFPVFGAVAALALCRIADIFLKWDKPVPFAPSLSRRPGAQPGLRSASPNGTGYFKKVHSAQVALVAGVLAVCVLVPLSWNRLRTMSDALLIWEDAAKLLARGDEPGAGRVYYNRAVALLAKGRNVEALADMDRVVRLHPRLAPVFHTRALVQFELKRYAEAVQDLNASIVLDPNRREVYFARAVVLKRLGRDDEALQDFQKSCELKDVIGCYAVQKSGAAEAKLAK